MKAIFEGTRNKLDYVCTKLRNQVGDFYLNDLKNERFTRDMDAVIKLENELDKVENIINTGYCEKLMIGL